MKQSKPVKFSVTKSAFLLFGFQFLAMIAVAIIIAIINALSKGALQSSSTGVIAVIAGAIIFSDYAKKRYPEKVVNNAGKIAFFAMILNLIIQIPISLVAIYDTNKGQALDSGALIFAFVFSAIMIFIVNYFGVKWRIKRFLKRQENQQQINQAEEKPSA